MEARAAPRFEGLLAEAGRLLASSLDVDETLRTVARLAVPEFAEWATVELVDDAGNAREVPSAAAPALLELAREARASRADGGASIADTGGRSWLVTPLAAGERELGTVTFVAGPDRAYAEADIPVALELAERSAQAVLNAELYDEAESARVLLDTIFDTAPVGMGLFDTELRCVLVNQQLADMDGKPVAAHLGVSIGDLFGADADVATAYLRQVAARGEPIRDVEIVADPRAFLCSYSPVAVDGRVLGVICAVVETTERHRAQRERERLLERTTQLQHVAERLSAALGQGEVAQVIVEGGMAATGATCGVLGLCDDEATLQLEHRYGLAGSAPASLPLDAAAPMPAAVRSGAPVLVASHADWLERFPDVPPRGEFEAFAAVPLIFEARVIGVMGLGHPHANGFDAADAAALVAIARQGAAAIERARLYEERAYVARTLQAGLLPAALPDIPGLDVAVLYRPIGDGAEVGGDFYDLFATADDEWLIAVGDICGKGTGAAVLAGIVRSTIRALALHDCAPAALLDGVNRALRREPAEHALASAACATIRPDGDGFTVRLAVSGHPPALVLRAAGTVEEVPAHGALLGVLDDPEAAEVTVALAHGDVLLLYTDGIIDAHGPGSEPFGEPRLHEALAAAAGHDARAVLDVVDAAVHAHAPGPPRDDKALLALRVTR